VEARTGNSATPKAVAAKAPAPRDRLLPLSYVEFAKPIQLEGFPMMMRHFDRDGKPDRDVDKACPKMFLDPELQAIVIDGEHFPIHHVVKYRRAKAA